ncbi:MAG: nicotinamide mononucleotide transporter [Bacteroidales bacterium]|nr:nicotinamide mononucleotide transporter [Bacteroidales bacterium]
MILTFLTPQAADILEIVATLTFVCYLVLQIMHSKWMWYLYIPSCICAALNFFNSATWAFAALNVYYIVMGFVGIHSWRKDEALKKEGKTEEDGSVILLNHLPRKTLIVSTVMVLAGIPALFFLLKALDDPNPFLDAITTALSIIGTWWLTRSYIQQWWIWIVADLFAIWMNVNLDNKWFVVQFILCIISSFIGLWNWKRQGRYING